jgi:hypothetical protein
MLKDNHNKPNYDLGQCIDLDGALTHTKDDLNLHVHLLHL